MAKMTKDEEQFAILQIDSYLNGFADAITILTNNLSGFDRDEMLKQFKQKAEDAAKTKAKEKSNIQVVKGLNKKKNG